MEEPQFSTEAFINAAALAMDRFEYADGPYKLLDVISKIIPFNAAISMVYARNAAPIYVADTFPDPKAKTALEYYIAGTYVLNPVYNAYLKGLKSGVYRIT